MVALIFTILFGLGAVISFLVAMAIGSNNSKIKAKKAAADSNPTRCNYNHYKDELSTLPAWITCGVLGFLAIVVMLIGSIVIIPNGNVAVMVRFQKPTGQILESGMHFKNMIDNPINMTIQTQKYEVPCEAASKDLQDVTCKIAINYKLNRDKASYTYTNIGIKYFEVVGQPTIQEVVKAVTAQFNAEDMILKREIVKQAITDNLTTRLSERAILTETVNITDFAFSPEFTAAIESKVSAAQSVLQALNKLEQIKVEAQQAKEAAIGKADAAIEEANGQAQSIKIVTEAQVKSNEDIKKSLSPEVLQYIFIDRLGSDVKVWVVPNGQSFNVNP